MLRDAERVDRVTTAIGPELFASLVDEWTAIGRDLPVVKTCFRDVAMACRAAEVPPEAMLVAVRVLSRTFFAARTPESDRIEKAWHRAVRAMMNAYYDPAVNDLP